MTTLKVLKAHPNVVFKKAHPSDAAFDVGVFLGDCEDKVYTLSPGIRKMFDTGLRFEIPEGYMLKVFPRSSSGKEGLRLMNTVGIIDSHYRGPMKVIVENVSDESFIFKNFGRYFQATLEKVEEVSVVEVSSLEDLSTSDRGEGGFGSTGV